MDLALDDRHAEAASGLPCSGGGEVSSCIACQIWLTVPDASLARPVYGSEVGGMLRLTWRHSPPIAAAVRIAIGFAV